MDVAGEAHPVHAATPEPPCRRRARIAVVQIAMTMPVMEPDLDATVLQKWARAIDEGPFSSLCWGERIAFDNPDSLTLLGALSAWTDRVRLVTTVIVPQLHDPMMLAKALATGDMLSGGRLTVGIGVGGRHEDYHAVGADPTTQTMRGMAERVAVMKRVWAGEKITDSVLPVGPRPGAARRSAAARRQHRAEDRPQRRGLGRRPGRHHAGPRRRQAERAVRRRAGRRGRRPASPNPIWRRRSGSRSGRPSRPAPRCIGICCRYMNWIPAEYVDAMAPTTGWAGTEDELVAVLRKFEEIGTDEIQLIPTSSDLDQVRRAADVVGRL